MQVLYDKQVESLTTNSVRVAPSSRAWRLLTSSIFDKALVRLITDTQSTWTGSVAATTGSAWSLLPATPLPTDT